MNIILTLHASQQKKQPYSMASIRSAYALWVEKSQLFEYQLAA